MKLDRRNSPRFICRHPVNVLWEEKDEWSSQSVDLLEISHSGIKFGSERPLRLGKMYQLEIIGQADSGSFSFRLIDIRTIDSGFDCIGEIPSLNDSQSSFIYEFTKNLPAVRDRRNEVKKRGSVNPGKRDRRLNNPLFLKCIRFNRGEKLIEKNQYFYFRELQGGSERRVRINGKEMVNLASNNYLGLNTHPEVIEAAIKATERYGLGTGGARILSGTMDLHNRLEEELAKFKKGEACAVFSTGYSANVGIISTLVTKNDHLIVDSKSHASIIDGCRLSGAEISVFRHNDMKSLRKKLEAVEHTVPKLIVTDGVFSMDGDVAKLNEMVGLADEFNAAVMVDDAHGMGVLGETGRGTLEHFHLSGDSVDLVMGTLSKALGGMGGFVIAKKKIIHCLKNISRPFLFTTSFPPAICASALKALEILDREPKWHERLWENIHFLKKELIESGFDIGETNSAIFPILIRDELLTYKITQLLEEEGIFVSPVAYPAVRPKESRLRVSLMATHTLGDLSFFLGKLKKVCKRAGFQAEQRL